jgi:hypothetical protein
MPENVEETTVATTQVLAAPNPDPLLDLQGGGERVAYATGRMLNTEDFQAEQLYHRSRLAHALLWLHGPGTVSGLNVTTATSPSGEPELQISPGSGIDRAGRLVEVFNPLCIRLETWLEGQSASDLKQAYKDVSSDPKAAAPKTFIAADVFVGFLAEEQGKTPSFASGDYEATDAFTANRMLDSFSAQLRLRPESVPIPLPEDSWAPAFDPSGVTFGKIKDALLSGQNGPAMPTKQYPPSTENIFTDTNSLFLARVKIPATQANPGDTPKWTVPIQVTIDNYSRNFVYSTSLLSRWLTQSPFVAPPSAASSPGIPGQMAFDATHLYVCVAANTWVRATLASF